MKSKKSQIWISAVIYMALGIIVLSIILAAAIPLIDKLKDRNTVAETKNLLLTVDETIKVVASEGPGSQRELSPLRINEGSLRIEDNKDVISWQLKTYALILEPNLEIKEGVLKLYLNTTPVKDEYIMSIVLDYREKIDIVLNSQYQSPFTGLYSSVIIHNGTYSKNKDGDTIPAITFKIL